MKQKVQKQTAQIYAPTPGYPYLSLLFSPSHYILSVWFLHLFNLNEAPFIFQYCFLLVIKKKKKKFKNKSQNIPSKFGCLIYHKTQIFFPPEIEICIQQQNLAAKHKVYIFLSCSHFQKCSGKEIFFPPERKKSKRFLSA